MASPSSTMKISDRIQLMALKWDSTKEPHKTERFIDDVLHLINQLEGGEWMVYFLDHFLCRAKKNETFPTFMGGSVFDLTPSRPTPRPLDGVDPGEEEEEDEGAQPSAHSADIVGGGEMQKAPVIDYIKILRRLEAPSHLPLQVQKSALGRCHTSSLWACGPRRLNNWTRPFTPRYLRL